MTSHRRDEARLRTTFRRILFLSSLAAPWALQACGGDDATTSAGDGGADASAGTDATSGSGDAAKGEDGAAPDSAMAADVASPPPQDAGVDAALDASEGGGPSPTPLCSDASASAPYFLDAGVDGAPCYYYVDFSCPMYRPSPGLGCPLGAPACLSICNVPGYNVFDCSYTNDHGCDHGTFGWEAGTPVTVACGLCPGVGRRPVGLAREDVGAASDVGAYFARAAHLEAASVHAFERLRDELVAHGAPRALVRLAERSAKDEVRHARVTEAIARRYGCAPPKARVRRRGVRTLERVAVENAVEGCVRETFGAMVATWQAAHAKDARVRRSMKRIAADETRHAALAWAVARWAEERLGARAVVVARARRRAVVELAREVLGSDDDAIAEETGLPRRAEARVLLREMARALWA